MSPPGRAEDGRACVRRPTRLDRLAALDRVQARLGCVGDRALFVSPRHEIESSWGPRPLTPTPRTSSPRPLVGSSAAPLSRRRWNRPRPDSSRSARFSVFLLGALGFCSATLSFASEYDWVTSSLPPVQPKTQMTRTVARSTFHAVVISCCAVE